MPEKPFNQQLLDRITELAELVRLHQVWMFALVAYVREHPSYDAARFRALYQEQRKRMGLPHDDTDPDDALLEMLRAFEGPIH